MIENWELGSRQKFLRAKTLSAIWELKVKNKNNKLILVMGNGDLRKSFCGAKTFA
jgi:hypothetical protein